jgi:hypothetical protein
MLPKKYIVVPILLCVILVPWTQALYLFGFHLFVSRIIFLMAFGRVLMGSFASTDKMLAGGFTTIDKFFLLSVLCEAVGFMLLYLQAGAVIYQVGFLWDYLLAYFVLRSVIRDEADIYRVIKVLAVICLIVGISMVREQYTMNNIFGTLGGVRIIPDLREGKIRSQGPFLHELTAGMFGAVLLPVFFILWKNRKSTFFALLGAVGCTMMTVSSNSSTSLSAYAAAVLAICLWPLRRQMRMMRWGLVLTILALAAVMKAPVWFLIARIDLTGGSSGYHRAYLIDQCIRNFFDWWLIGTKDPTLWAVGGADLDLWDTQNQFVTVAETGGLLGLVFFLAYISSAFSMLGKARKFLEGQPEEWLFWGIGASLFANVVGFFGVNLFDQSKMEWFLLLAFTTAATVPVLAAANVAKEADPLGSVVDANRFGYPALPRPSVARTSTQLRPLR